MSDDDQLPDPLNESIRIGVHVPDDFWELFGYYGKARYVAIYWTPMGDEAMYEDGRIAGTANWSVYFVLRDHPDNGQLRNHIDLLGSSETAATHWLVIDRDNILARIKPAYILPTDQAHLFLASQHPATVSESVEGLTASFDELAQIIASIDQDTFDFEAVIRLLADETEDALDHYFGDTN